MRLGIIGCGLIGQKRAKAAVGHDVTLVADRDEGRAKALAASLPRARACADWHELVAGDVDAVVVATSHDVLAPIALAAIEAGKHVLLEKPGARSASELAPLLEAASRRKVVVKVGFNHRFHPALWKTKQLVSAGELGKLMFIRGRYGHGGRVGYEKEWRFVPEISGGGELLDQGSHLIVLSRWILGEDFTDVQGTCARYFWESPVEDNAFLTLRTAGGQVAWLHATWTEWKNLFSFEVYGETGKLHVEGLGGSYGTERLAFYKMSPKMGPPETTIWEYPFPDTSWDREFEEFVAAVRERREPIGGLADASAVLTVVDAVYGRARP